MTQRDRIYTLAQARTDRPAPPRRRKPHTRATVRPDDPSWLHEGQSLVLTIKGEPHDFFSVGVMAKAIGRSTESTRRLIRTGVLPEARYRTPGRPPFGAKRLWTRDQVMAVASAAQTFGVTTRRRDSWTDGELLAALATTATV